MAAVGLTRCCREVSFETLGSELGFVAAFVLDFLLDDDGEVVDSVRFLLVFFPLSNEEKHGHGLVNFFLERSQSLNRVNITIFICDFNRRRIMLGGPRLTGSTVIVVDFRSSFQANARIVKPFYALSKNEYPPLLRLNSRRSPLTLAVIAIRH